MATTTVNRRTDLVDTQSVSYIRQLDVKVLARECKPNTRLYPFFDGERVDEFVVPVLGVNGDPLLTDIDGNLSAIFSIPGFKFSTGKKLFSLSESPVYIPLDAALPGTGTGCRATFNSTGVREIYQETVDTKNVVTIENVVRVEVVDPTMEPKWNDPVAQSCNTYGVTGGCFVTAIDLFFYSKDETIPVSIEIREMVNGYPSPKLATPNARVTLNPAYIQTSADASLSTRFYFPKMVYIGEDTEFCFVVMTNSKKYNIFTSVLGETSLENGATVFDQPYLGSIFKSQNNSTWTAHQYEDIKFTLYVANFNVGVIATVPVAASTAPVLITSDKLSTVENSNIITATLPFKHGLTLNSSVQLSVPANCVFNGIASADILGTDNGTWVIQTIIDDYSFTFAVGAQATSTGKILHGENVQFIHIDSAGAGYSDTNPPIINISGDGINATATATVRDGKVVDIIITNAGTGYTKAPTVTLTTTQGIGCVLTATMDMKFSIITNRIAHTINPGLSHFTPSGTTILANLKNTLSAFPGGNINSYATGSDTAFDLNKRIELDQNTMVCSRANENSVMSNSRGTIIELKMSSTNPNVSPMFDATSSRAMFNSNIVNNQETDTILATSATASLDSIVIASGGVGYSTVPTVVFTNAVGDTGTGAAAHAVVSSGVITNIVIDNYGSGYIIPPVITFTNVTPTTPAYATAVLTQFNTELLPNSGRSKSKYITKINTLATISKGMRVFVTAYSSENTSIDLYLRTTLSSSSLKHTEQNWKLMQCDTQRNRSRNNSEFYEYEFYLNDVGLYDNFDIKIVMNSKVPFDVPVISDYRAIVIL